jgi:hypothetical protein
VIRGDVGFGNEPAMREAEQRRKPLMIDIGIASQGAFY